MDKNLGCRSLDSKYLWVCVICHWGCCNWRWVGSIWWILGWLLGICWSFCCKCIIRQHQNCGILFYSLYTSCTYCGQGFHMSMGNCIQGRWCSYWVKTHYGWPKATNVVFIISHFHSVKLESLFQNCKHPPLKVRICGFQKRFCSKILHTIYCLKSKLKFINVWISRIKINS